MSARGWYLILMLALLFLANLGMLMGMTNWPQRHSGVEGFVSSFPGGRDHPPGMTSEQYNALSHDEKQKLIMKCKSGDCMDDYAPYNASQSLEQGAGFQRVVETFAGGKKSEGFMDYLVNGFGTAPIGTYDGMDLGANLPPESQGFRARMPNVPHPPGTEMLPFVNNECKPECCGSSMSCDSGGCLCTTPEDRNLINTRGGNRRSGDI
jgi:hypothetical protein